MLYVLPLLLDPWASFGVDRLDDPQAVSFGGRLIDPHEEAAVLAFYPHGERGTVGYR